MCSPFVLAKRDHLISSPFSFFLVNVMHFRGLVGRAIVSNTKSHESPFSSSLVRLRGSDSFIGHASRLRLVQHQNSGRRMRGRTLPVDEQLIDCELRLLAHELANFVM